MLETRERQLETPIGMQISGVIKETYHEVLSNEALDFLVALHEHFNEARSELLKRRVQQQKAFDEGTLPDFLPETKGIRDSSWTVAPVPKDIQDRRVEITGPVDRKMIINALNSGARVFMADFEDSNSPTWSNVVEGQINLRDAVNKTIEYENENGKKYTLNNETSVLFVRPRGLHLPEKNIKIHGSSASGALVDFGLYFFHNAHELLRRGTGPYFYLPKLESYLEARLWNDIFKFSQSYLGIPSGTIKATVLVETMPAVFQLNEILFELKDHSAGLNCGRWDYIFSFIKKFNKNPKRIFPNRDQVNMTVPFMKAYTDLVIHTCHKRNIHAMGGMAAQIPIKNDPEANKAAIDKVRQDKLREVEDGHDGTWVAHPGLVSVAMEVFNEHMPESNQIENKRLDVAPNRDELLKVPTGTITEYGLRTNINVGLLYLESWLSGNGAAALYNLMEDAATAEISRTQLWQWIHHPSYLSNGKLICEKLYERIKKEELLKIKEMLGNEAFDQGRFSEAEEIFDKLVLQDELTEFLTLEAYNYLK